MPETDSTDASPAHKQHGTAVRAEDVPEKVRVWLERMRRTADPDACWLYSKRSKLHKYSCCRLQPYLKTHRAVLALVLGEVPAGMFACHRCDNKGCCNPNHLFIGSNLDNVRDRDRKDRGQDGNVIARRMKLWWETMPPSERHAMTASAVASRRNPARVRAVIDPSGRRWQSACAAASAYGVTDRTIRVRCDREIQGWSWDSASSESAAA